MQAIKNLLPIFSMIIAVLFFSSAQAGDVYTIEDIWVEKSSTSATAAKKLGRSEAEGVAFDKLMRSMITDEDYYNLPVLSKEEISALVKGFEVSEENITRKGYKARYSVSFFPHMVKALFEENEINYVENKSQPTLILPIYQQGSDVTLWETDNPWWIAWSNVVSESNVMPMVLPQGDIEDVALLSVEDAYSADYSILNTLAAKYKAKDVLIVEAQYDGQGFSGKPALEVVLKLVEKDATEKRRAHYDGDYETTQEYLFNSSVSDLVSRLESDWLQKTQQKQINKVKTEEPNITVDIGIRGLANWIKIKKEISNIDVVKKLEVIGVSATQAKVKLFYKEDFATFSYFLGTEGFNLRKLEGTDSWFLETS